MSELHYDADGEPAKVPAAAEELRVRRFRKPGERGACEIVHGADGAPLYVPIDATYTEFRALVDSIPGRYRLDPVDASRMVCKDAAPLYVTIDPPRRNQAGAGDDRDGVMRELLRAHVEMMKANNETMRAMTERLAGIMTASAELLRAADGANLPRREALPPVEPVVEVDDEDEQDDEDPANPLAETVAHFLQQAMPLLETYVADRLASRRRAEAATAKQEATAPSAPAPAAATTATASSSSTTPAASSPAAPDSSAPPTGAGPAEVRNAGAPRSAPTGEQMQHLIAVKAKLSPQEQRVVMSAIPRMEPEARAHWLAELCALPVEDAAALVRSMMPPLRAEPGKPTPKPKAAAGQKETTS